MAVSILDGNILKYAESNVYWMPISELPEPLNPQ